jgi:hypothetical protein
MLSMKKKIKKHFFLFGSYLKRLFKNNNETLSARLVPFRIIFKTNQDESLIAAIPAQMSELSVFPSGTIGFSLKFTQGNC